eukprot:scaffold579_cov146-Ochromonas_danica.AAC.8
MKCLLAIFLAVCCAINSIHAFNTRRFPCAPFSRTCRLLSSRHEAEASKPRVVIEYCPGCRWMLRSAYMAQELLSTFESSLEEVALKPSSVSGEI